MPILKQYLCHFKFDSPRGLPISNRKIGRETRVPDYRCQCVAMLMGLPLTVEQIGESENGIGTKDTLFTQICMTCDEIKTEERARVKRVAYRFRCNERGLDGGIRVSVTKNLK